MRLHDVSCGDGGLAGDRRRAGDAHGLATDDAGAAVRDKGCRFPGCDRQFNWSSPHHIEFWARGGPGKLENLVLLCFFHHRLVHEGGWQVVKAGREFKFLAPDRVVMRRARGPGYRWAA